MNKKDISRSATALLALMALVACDNKPAFVMPEVNDTNCSTAAIKSLPVEVQKEFGSKCARGGSYTGSGKGRTW